ncbi:hypothetical protein V8E53_015029 [Lactarius tabidus]
MSYQRPVQKSYLPSTRYWSDAVQRRLGFIENIIQQVPSSTLNDTQALCLINKEMSAIFAGPYRMIGSRHNSLTRSCRLPPEILGQIFVHYQESSSSFSFPSRKGRENYSPLCKTVLWWVPAVAHVCRHWRTVALRYPRLWSNIAFHLGRTWALRMLTLSKAVPITTAMSDPHPCRASIRPLSWGRLPKPGPPKLDPLEVLAKHLFHIRELELGACACTSRRWVSLLEATAPLLETLWLRINLHRSGLLPNTPIALPDNFLATHPRLRRLVLENAFFSSWALGSYPLAQLVFLTIIAPDPRHVADSSTLVLPTREQLLDCLFLMPALQELRLEHCLPDLASTYSPRTVSLLHLRTLTAYDCVDRCYQVLSQLDIPPTATMKVCCWSTHPHSELDCLRILPLLSAHLSRTGTGTSASMGGCRNGTSGPHALTLSSTPTNNDGHTHFVLSAWRAFTRPTVAEDRERYCGPKGDPDVRLECEWDVGDPEVERSVLLRACAGIPVAELRALSMRASATVWSADDWYDTFVGCSEITHVSAHDALAESLLDALALTNGSGSDTDTDGDDDNSASSEGNGVPLFQELVSLTLVGVDFVRANETASITLFDTMEWRQASPLCVTTLDRIELRVCTVEEEDVDSLRPFASVVVWDSITDAHSWPNEPWMDQVEQESGNDDDDEVE